MPNFSYSMFSSRLLFLCCWLAFLLGACGDGPPSDPSTLSESSNATSLPDEAPTPLDPDSLDPPAVPGSLAPRLAMGPSGPLLSWLEPLETGADGTADGHRFRLSRLLVQDGDRSWSEAVTLSQGEDFFANWADTPSVVSVPGVGPHGGGYWGQSLRMLGEATYAYGIALVRSEDGAAWQSAGLLHDDTSPTEHGFASFVPEQDAIRAFWLDGRAMLAEDGADGDGAEDGHGEDGHGDGGHGMGGAGPMQIRTTRVLADSGPEPSEVIDLRVCECCPTDAAVTDQGPVVVYRDRSNDEIRDIAIVRRVAGEWSEPRIVHADGWKILGCPVNGPAIVADAQRVLVAWFTAADNRPRVQAAWSDDGGASFGSPMGVDEAEPVGRVDLQLAPSGDGIVTWMGQHETEDGRLVGRIRVRRLAPDGTLGPPRWIAETSPRRAAGVPRALVDGDRLIVTWVEDRAEQGEPSRLRTASVPLSSI